MRKLSLIAAGVSMALAGTANASLDSLVNASIFISGASAPSNMLRENVVRNTCNPANPITVYVDAAKAGTTVATALPLLEHTTHWVVQCTAAATAGPNLAGKTVAIYKSDAGGSGNGTTPVANSVALPFLNADPATCSLVGSKAIQNGGGATFSIRSCGTSATLNQIPDGGASDIEPTKFTGSLAPSSGNFVDNGNLTVRSGPGLIFAPAVSLAFRNELQNDQVASGLLPANCTDGSDDYAAGVADREEEACMPSLPSTYIRTLTEGKQQFWSGASALNIYSNSLTVPTTFAGADGILGTSDDVTPTGANATLKNYVHLCRRVQGSGTHAEWMIHYHRTNCQSGTYPMPGQPGLTSGKPAVFEASSSGNLGLCLDALDQGTAYTGVTPSIAAGRASYAIGYQATEKNQSNGENWRFVKVDGDAPTRENVYNGDYDQVYFLSFQNRNDNSYVAGPLRATSLDVAAVNEFFASNLNIDAGVAADINQGFEFTWGGAGFVIPSSSAPTTFSASNPLVPWARETVGSPDSCQPLTRK